MYQHAKYTELKNVLKNNKLQNFCKNKITKKSAKPRQKNKKKKKVSDNAFEIPQQSKKGLERATQSFSTYPPSTEPMRRSSLSHG